ncbi:MAG TPA: hypothetical protein VKA70_12745 [Blastocatellia bacterium]|nr:hypothetical protein [Blastocatellia bacterium]
MKNPLKNIKFMALSSIIAGVVALINVLFFDEPGGFPRGLSIAFAAGAVILGIILLFVSDKPDSPDLKENR